MVQQQQQRRRSTYEVHEGSKKLQYILKKCKKTSDETGEFTKVSQMIIMPFQNARRKEQVRGDEIRSSAKKQTHSQGVVAGAKFVGRTKNGLKGMLGKSAHHFTGMFKGNPNVLIRLSHAKRPTAANMVPVLGVKFFQDGKPSVNFAAMHSFDGQKTGNFFQHELSNHIPRPTGFLSKINGVKFNRPDKVGILDLAKTTCKGETLEEEIHAPYQLFLVPNPELTDQHGNIAPNAPLQTMFQIPINTLLYDVYGIESADSTERIHIGSIITTTGCISSKYGDECLFFRQQKFEQDLAFHQDQPEPQASSSSTTTSN